MLIGVILREPPTAEYIGECSIERETSMIRIRYAIYTLALAVIASPMFALVACAADNFRGGPH